MGGAATPRQVTHAICLNKDILWHAIGPATLANEGHIKVIENRGYTMSPGWYGVSLSQSSHTSVMEEIAAREWWTSYKGPLATEKGRVLGLIKIGHTLPQSAVVGDEWACPNYKYANIIVDVLPFAEPGPHVSGNLGSWPLPPAVQDKLLVCIAAACDAGRWRRTYGEELHPPAETQTHTGTSKASHATKTKAAAKATGQVPNKSATKPPTSAAAKRPAEAPAKVTPAKVPARPSSPGAERAGQDIRSFFTAKPAPVV